MPRYSVRLTSSAGRDLRLILSPDRAGIQNAIIRLADEPRPAGSRKMSGFPNLFRIRVGRYRVVYEIHDRVLLVIVTSAGKRDKIYKIAKRR